MEFFQKAFNLHLCRHITWYQNAAKVIAFYETANIYSTFSLCILQIFANIPNQKIYQGCYQFTTLPKCGRHFSTERILSNISLSNLTAIIISLFLHYFPLQKRSLSSRYSFEMISFTNHSARLTSTLFISVSYIYQFHRTFKMFLRRRSKNY